MKLHTPPSHLLLCELTICMIQTTYIQALNYSNELIHNNKEGN